MPQQKRVYTLEQVEARQAKGITGLRNLGLDDAADDLEALTPSEYAEHKGLLIENSERKGVVNMPGKTRQELLDDVDYWQGRAEAAEEKLEEIATIATEEPEVEEGDDED